MAKNTYKQDESLETPFTMSQYKRALAYVRKYSTQMILALSLSILSAVLTLSAPLITSKVIDEVIPNKDANALFMWIIIYVVFIAIAMIFVSIRAKIMTRVGQGIVFDIRGDVPRLFDKNQPTEFNKGRVLSEGDDVTIFTSSVCTEESLRAIGFLKSKGVSVQHVHITTLKPFTDPLVVESIQKAKHGVITMENHSVIGGLGSAVGEVMLDIQANKPLRKVGINDVFTHGASKPYLMEKYGIDAMALIKAVEDLTGENYNATKEDLDQVRLVDNDAV